MWVHKRGKGDGDDANVCVHQEGKGDGDDECAFSDMHKVSEGMGDKVAVFVQWSCTWLTAYVIAFIKGWKLALCICPFSPLMMGITAMTARVSHCLMMTAVVVTPTMKIKSTTMIQQ